MADNGFPMGTILATFIYKLSQYFVPSFESNGCLGQERPSWITDRNKLHTFDLQVVPILPTKFRVKWPFGSGDE